MFLTKSINFAFIGFPGTLSEPRGTVVLEAVHTSEVDYVRVKSPLNVRVKYTN